MKCQYLKVFNKCLKVIYGLLSFKAVVPNIRGPAPHKGSQNYLRGCEMINRETEKHCSSNVLKSSQVKTVGSINVRKTE